MASLVPTSRFSSVDLPAFGRPMNETKPDFIDAVGDCLASSAVRVGCVSSQIRTLLIRRRSASSTSTRQAVDVEPLADRRHAARGATAGSRRRSRTLRARSATSSRCATSSMSTLPLNTNRPLPSSTIGSDSTSYSSRISPTISSSRSSIVTRPAVPPYSSTTIAHLRLLALELLQQLGHPLGLGHDDRRPQQRRDRPRVVVAAQRDQILHEHEAGDVVEAVLVDRKPRVLLLAEQRAQVADRRRLADARRCRAAASSPRGPACRRSRRCSAAAGAPRPR